MDMETILHRVESEFIGCPVGLSASDPSAGHPHGESRGIVVASIALFAHGGASELAAPDDEGLFEEAACFEIGEESGDGFIDGAAESGVIGFDAFVAVPLTSGAAVELDEADAIFDEAPCEEAVSSEHRGFGTVHAVELFCGFRFFGKVDGRGRFGLHFVGEFVATDSCFEFGVIGARGVVVAIERGKEIEFFALA